MIVVKEKLELEIGGLPAIMVTVTGSGCDLQLLMQIVSLFEKINAAQSSAIATTLPKMTYPALNAALNWSGNTHASPTFRDSCRRLILISDEVRTDGSFLLHHFIDRHLRSEEGGAWKVALLGLAQSIAHYSLIGKKLVGS